MVQESGSKSGLEGGSEGGAGAQATPVKATAGLGRVVLAAALAGIAAGAAALYASGALTGNSGGLQLADACSAKAGLAQSVAAHATGDVAAMAATEPRSLAALTFNDGAGAPLSIADFSGRTVLLNLWATWCAPCRAEMPALDALQAEMGGAAFEVVALNLDRGQDSKPQDFYAETGIRHLAHYRDGSLKSFNDLKRAGLVLGLPVTMLIDGDGCLLASMNGPAHWNGADAKRYVSEALKAVKPGG
jgi:thiol-disulfide isomerase/thioredoxin